jgi:hypothetical protein
MTDGSAPALECLKCRALCLDESAAESEQERESVRLAVAARRRVHGALMSDRVTAPPPSGG